MGERGSQRDSVLAQEYNKTWGDDVQKRTHDGSQTGGVCTSFPSATAYRRWNCPLGETGEVERPVDATLLFTTATH